ncbi:putative ph-response regulator protein [Eutypa lata UCREL1]|uniref:Putative ph-response regulator protein n=1 Tax=Eutypa lata (strain UCR-EL1) TaxID=1287681 RepID=M7T1L1_EUTLA|nr:putative ph-response regulator protein [Eutypa lata UCREL1]
MARTGFIHHIGSFLLLVATVLLIVTSISAPTVHNLSMLRIEIDGSVANRDNPVITLGTFGWCVQNTMASGEDNCSRAKVGYDPTAIVEEVLDPSDGVDFSDYASDSSRALTYVMVLHPVAAGLAFISFLLALGAGIVGSLLAALVALLTFLVTLVALVCDFVGLALVRHAVNDANNNSNNSSSSSDRTISAMYGSAAWTLLAAAICVFLGMLVVFFTCCSARIHRRREARGGVKTDYGVPPATPARRRWRF